MPFTIDSIWGFTWSFSDRLLVQSDSRRETAWVEADSWTTSRTHSNASKVCGLHSLRAASGACCVSSFEHEDGSSSSNRKESLLRSKWARPPGVVEGLDDLEHMESVEAMGVIIAGRLELLEEAVEKDLRYPLRRPSRTTSASSQPPCWKSTAEAVVEH
eukprot:CAMPEP_0206459244 /NCGR_PEP_ID=MMETSP0324_2-20121206/24063_1 /ASSEMBLY_ACC=CAM_ASM_000836 /TAXON_ID=2866 /ORGANISM="Crypthecodinium cohnii, Strain Seligo" /LENGTH=158 /DNA_ID=CAMNT_0053930763 /DNA_START=664 /DNA_END=1140 /DNA_ORIENTATION=+